MSYTAYYISEAVERLRCDPTLKEIFLYCLRRTDEEMAELADCLLAHPDVVTHVYLNGNRLTDETGIKLARYVAISSTIKTLDLTDNRFGLATYLAIAAALRVNTSLQNLFFYNNQVISIEAAFIDALILNPNRPVKSIWTLYSWNQNDFERLNVAAEQLGHPSMQASLAMLAI